MQKREIRELLEESRKYGEPVGSAKLQKAIERDRERRRQRKLQRRRKRLKNKAR